MATMHGLLRRRLSGNIAECANLWSFALRHVGLLANLQLALVAAALAAVVLVAEKVVHGRFANVEPES